MSRRLLTAAAAVASIFALTASAQAHPHVLVTATADIVFSDNGASITAIREIWSFDEMYTAFAITGFGRTAQEPSAEQLNEVAKQNMDDLLEYNYFTVLKSDREQARFEKPTRYAAQIVKTGDNVEKLKLTFDLPLKKSLPAGKQVELRVYDPSYFTAFSFEPGDAVKLKGPTKCVVSRAKPNALSAIDQMALSESYFTNMLPGTDFGIKMAETVHISCP